MWFDTVLRGLRTGSPRTGLGPWCVLRGGPLTGFGRGRPNLPLPSERVKSGGTTDGGPLTGFGRGRPNPSASSGQALPFPQERVMTRTPGRFSMSGG